MHTFTWLPHTDAGTMLGLESSDTRKAAKQFRVAWHWVLSITIVWHANTQSNTEDHNSWLTIHHKPPPKSLMVYRNALCPLTITSICWVCITFNTQTHAHRHYLSFSILMRILKYPGHKMVTPQHSLERDKQRRSTSANLSLVFIPETRRGTARSGLYKSYRMSTVSNMERWNTHTCVD